MVSGNGFFLTASVFGTFLRIKDTTDTVKTFKNKKMFFTSKSVKHGIQYENAALAKYNWKISQLKTVQLVSLSIQKFHSLMLVQTDWLCVKMN